MKKLLILLAAFVLSLGIFGASFSLRSFAWGNQVSSPHVYSAGTYENFSGTYTAVFSSPWVAVLGSGSHLNDIYIYTQGNVSWVMNGSSFNSGTYTNITMYNLDYSPNSQLNEAFIALRNYQPSVFDEDITLNPQWSYMTGNGLLILNPSANVTSTDIKLHNLTTGNDFDYSTGSGHVAINFDSSIATIGDRIQWEMIPKDSSGNYGCTYYIAQTLDLLNLTDTTHYVSTPYVEVPVDDTVINLPVSGVTSYQVYNNNPVTNFTSSPVTNYSLSIDYSNTEYNSNTIEVINQYVVNNYTSTNQQVVNNYVSYQYNTDVDVVINITTINQAIQNVKELGLNFVNLTQNIKGIFEIVFAFLPAWLIALIFTGLGFIILLILVKIGLLLL